MSEREKAAYCAGLWVVTENVEHVQFTAEILEVPRKALADMMEELERVYLASPYAVMGKPQ